MASAALTCTRAHPLLLPSCWQHRSDQRLPFLYQKGLQSENGSFPGGAATLYLRKHFSRSLLVTLPVTATATGNGAGGAGGEGGSGGEGGGGGPGDGGEEDQSGNPKKLKTSQIITLVYAATVLAGGIIGFLKKRSKGSLASGLTASALLAVVFNLLATDPVKGSILGLGVSSLLLVAMGLRFSRSKRFLPAGAISLLSLVMTAGYVHGIARGLH
eukprot:TRINITY_DN4468_c0_g1_i2.p1 TRINITY_DN4468_c0_g1~~TRINITY_DN4468_c0_g1_i2.p1  ORF type:complete len:222 (-),score=47.94 TRINITY_DN4468_c0_g1_i2:383-1027(-)